MQSSKRVSDPLTLLAREGSYGGYTYYFAESVGPELCCTLCTEVLKEPHLTSCCGQHYCSSCLKEWLDHNSENHSCPICRETEFTHILDKSVDRKVKTLKVYCEYRQDGCSWAGELSDLESHLPKCDWGLTSCSNMCGDRMKQQDLSNHLANDCILRKHKCEHCGLEDSYKFITGKHVHKCPDCPLKCPNQCSARRVKRRLLSKHLERCPKQKVECQFHQVGCRSKFMRVDEQRHIAMNVQKHCCMLLKGFRKATQAVITEAEILTANMSDTQKLPLQCMKTLMGSYSSELKENGQILTFRMPDYSKFKSSGRYWRSPVFSISGYRMHLVVATKGIEEGRGSHISVVLKAESHDNCLAWTKGGINIEMVPQSESSLIAGCSCSVHGQNIPWKDLEGKDGLPVRLFSCPTFAEHADVESSLLLNDSLVFQLRRILKIMSLSLKHKDPTHKYFVSAKS